MIGKLWAQPIDRNDALKTFGQPVLASVPPSFELLIWNVFKGKKAQWLSDFNTLIGETEFLLLQEAFVTPQFLSQLTRFHDYQWHMAQSMYIPQKNLVSGVKTGSTVRSVYVDYQMSQTTEPFLKIPKMALLTQYPIQEHEGVLSLINIHALNFVGIKQFVGHIESLHLWIQSCKGPLILAGDFNTWNAQRRRYLDRFVKDHGLHSVPFVRSKKLRHLNSVLDHVFYRGLVLDSFKELRNIGSSDHTPLYVVFSFA